MLKKISAKELSFINRGMVVAEFKNVILNSGIELSKNDSKDVDPTLEIIHLGEGCTTNLKVGDIILLSNRYANDIEELNIVNPKYSDKNRVFVFSENIILAKVGHNKLHNHKIK